MASAEVLYKEQGKKANPILHGNGQPVTLGLHDIDEKITYSSCAKTHHVWHQDCVAGKPSGWFRSSAMGWCKSSRTAKNYIPGYTGMQLCAHSSPCAKLRFPWAVLPPHTCKVLPLSLGQVPAQCLSGVGKFWYTACKLEEDWPHSHYHLCLHQQYHVPPSAQEFRCPGNFGRAVKATKRNLDRGYIP